MSQHQTDTVDTRRARPHRPALHCSHGDDLSATDTHITRALKLATCIPYFLPLPHPKVNLPGPG